MRISVGSVVKVKRDTKGRFSALWGALRIIKIGAVFGGILFLVGIVAFSYGQVEAAHTQTVVNQIVPTQKGSMAAVMARIAKCESGGKQFLPNGEVVTNTNSNGSVDVGKYQINLNAAHLKEMAKLGFNPLTEEGNEAFAKWIYENEGTGPWASSQHCWQ